MMLMCMNQNKKDDDDGNDDAHDNDDVHDEEKDNDDDNLEKGGAVGDFCTVLCCPGCAHIQQYKEVKSSKITIEYNLHHRYCHSCPMPI